MASEAPDKDLKKPEASSKAKSVPSIYALNFNSIITALHTTALEKCASKEYTIKNSAIDGDGKNAKFYGAGSQIIIAIPAENKGLDKNSIPKTKALELIQTYVQWFVGPDLKGSIGIDDLIPLENEDTGKVEDTSAKKADIEKSRGAAAGSEKASTASKEKYKESMKWIPSFSEYMILEDGEGDASGKSSEASGDKGDHKEKAPANKDAKSSEASGEKTDEGESATGYYIAYTLEMKPGEKGHPIADALKRLGGDFLKGFGVSFGNWRTGSQGEVKTVGDALNTLNDVFGKINPTEFLTAYQKNIKDNFKDTDCQSQIIDTKTIKKHLGSKLAGSDKALMAKADLALCTKVNKHDKSYKLFDKQTIADTVTASIKGIFKKLKAAVSPKEVILVNNYEENKKTKGEVKYTDKGEGEVKDSLAASYNGQLITEADEKVLSSAEKAKVMRGKLKNLAKDALKDSYLTSNIAPSKDVIALLKKNGISEPKMFDIFKKSPYSMYIKAKFERTEKKEDEDKEKKLETASLHASYSMMKMLFEDSSGILDEKEAVAAVKKVFQDLIYTFKNYLPKDAEMSEKALESIAQLEVKDGTETAKESIDRQVGLFSMLFEMLNEDADMIFEASNYGKGVAKEIIEKKGFKNLIANIPKMEAFIKANYKTEKGKKKEDSIRYKALALFEKFKECKSDDEMQTFIDDNFKDGGKDSDDNRVRTAFIKAMSIDGIPDKEDEEEDTSIEITFKDIDDPSELEDPEKLSDGDKEKYKDIGEPVKHIPGEDLELPEVKDKGKFAFDHFEPDPKEMKESGATYAIYKKSASDMTKITFFDADPESGEKKGDALGEIEVEQGTPINSSEDAQSKIEELNKKLEDDKKEGFIYKGWDPDVSNKAKGDEMEIVAKYIKEEEKDKEYTVMFQYAPDQTKPDDVETIQVDGEDSIKVKAGEKVDPPTPPEIDGYKFTGEWDAGDASLDNVNDDIVAVAKYAKMIKITPKAPKDPEKPDDVEGIGEPFEYDPEKPLKEQLPPPPEFKGWEHKGWDPDPESIKDPKEDIDITATYEKKDDKSEDGKSVHTVYFVIPDENGLLNAPAAPDAFKIKLVSTDPEDPDNTKSQEEVAVIQVVAKPNSDLTNPESFMYKVDDLKQAAKDAGSKEQADKFTQMADSNEKAFKSVDNIKAMDDKKTPYKFLGWTTDANGENKTFEKKEIEEVISDVIANGIKDEEVQMKTVWTNDVKQHHTDLDFYIVPMAGLGEYKKYDSAKGRTED